MKITQIHYKKRHKKSRYTSADRFAYEDSYTLLRAKKHSELIREHGINLSGLHPNAKLSYNNRYSQFEGWTNTTLQMDWEDLQRVTIPQLAHELYFALHTITRHNGDIIYTLKDDSPDWMSEAIHSAHGNEWPDDTIYEFIHDAAGVLSDCDHDADNDTLQEAIFSIEPDIYTSDLTAWLNARPDHMYYVDQAVAEFGELPDEFTRLSYGQLQHKQEVGYALLEALRDESESRS